MRKDRCQDTYSPLRLWAGRLLAFLGAGDARREEPAAEVGGSGGVGQGAGAMVFWGWLWLAMIRRQFGGI